jgi:GntR family transcriptional regulator
MPTERELCEQFNVSRITVRKAIEDLARDGLVQVIQGKGSIVTYGSLKGEAREVVGFKEIMRRQGLPTHSRVLLMETINGNPQLLSDFGFPINYPQRFIRIRRLRFIRGIPAVVIDTFLLEELGEKLKSYDLEDASFFELYEKNLGLKLIRDDATLSPIVVNKETADLLDVKPESAQFLFRFITYSTGNIPIEVAEGIYRVDVFEFTGARYQISEKGWHMNPHDHYAKKPGTNKVNNAEPKINVNSRGFV